MDEHAEDPVGHAGQKVVQYTSLATMAAEALAQVRQHQAATTAAQQTRSVAAERVTRTAALTAARPLWQPMLDGRQRERASIAETLRAWEAAQAWAGHDPHAALAGERALDRLRALRPDVLDRVDQLTRDGIQPVEAMRRAAPLFDQPPRATSRPPDQPRATPSGRTAPADSSPTELEKPRSLPAAGSQASHVTSDDPPHPAWADDHPHTEPVVASTQVAVLDAQPAADPADRYRRSPAQLARDGFPEPLTGEVLAAGRPRPKAPATTAPAAVRAVGLATAARAATQAR
jgi:hypothetical protein